MMKRLVLEFNLYWKFVCTDRIMIRTKQTYPLSPSTPVRVFLIAEKLLSL